MMYVGRRACITVCNNKMSQFRIQRKLTEGSSIRLKPTLSNPQRIRSLESKQSLSRSPKKIDQTELRRMVRRVSFKDSPQRTDAKDRLQQGLRAFREKDVGRALEIFREARRAGDRSAEVSYYIGSCQLNLGKHQASIISLNQCLQQNEKFNQNAYLYIAINFKLLGNPRQAIRILDKAASLFPNFEEGFFYKGKLSMKLGEWGEAVQAFLRCIHINPANDLATIFLGDCLKAQGKREKASERYALVLNKGKKHRELAVGRIGALLLEQKCEHQLYTLMKDLLKTGFQHPEASYYMGMSCWGLGKRNQAIVYLQSCLSSSKDASAASKALKALIRIAVQQGSFFEAEHHITRIQKLQLNAQSFKEWKLFVQGANDLIKRKNQPALDKISQALTICKQKQGQERMSSLQVTQFRKNVFPYAAYALYLNGKHAQSIAMYESALQLAEQRQKVHYAKMIVEGVSLHLQHKYQQAARKFHDAHHIQATAESLFLSSISLVQQFKASREKQSQLFGRIEQMLLFGRKLEPKFALFLFYSALVLMFLNKPCLEVVQQAILACEDPISQYHFIQALALQHEGKIPQALDAITKAIELDPGIQEFYRQRSKYHFMKEDYQAAIEDCQRAEEMAPDDEEIPLLLAFYYYLSDQFVKSYNCLLRATPSSGKLKEFQQALHLRLGMYDKLGEVGSLLIAIANEEVSQKLLIPLETFIAERYQFSEFSVYFYHLVLAVGYASLRMPQKALDHLFGCLQQIQMLVDEREGKHAVYDVTWQQTEQMLDEVKFNIVAVSLLKEDYEQTRHFIEVFLAETESQDLKETLAKINGLMTEQEQGEVRLMTEDDCPRISDRFPAIKIKLKRQTLVTKLLVSYPVKLKFTIAPQFDPAYLLNFDIDKVEYRVPPPWLRAAAHKANFTNSIRNESVLLSESQASERKPSKKSVLSIRQRLKLDREVEQKLKKLIQK